MRLIDDKVFEFIAKKVSNQNGDIRVAFDLMKTAIDSYATMLKETSMPEQDTDVRLTV